MNIRYVSPDLAWTESMKKSVHLRIVEPLAHHISGHDFEMSVHLEIGWRRTPILRPQFQMWVVLQTFDGGQNSIVRREGSNFIDVANAVSLGVREQLRIRKRKWFSLFSA